MNSSKAFKLIAMLLVLPLSVLATPLKIALPENGYPPYIILEQDSVGGILVEPMTTALNNLKMEFEFVYLPEKRSQKSLDLHQVDARMESTKWVANPAQYLWSIPISSVEDVLVSHKRSQFKLSTLDDLKTTEVITHIGYVYPTIDKYFKTGQSTKIEKYGESEMLNALLQYHPKPVRVAVMDIHVAAWLFKARPVFNKTLTIGEAQIDFAPLQFQFAKSNKNHDRLLKINNELDRLKKAGVFQRLEQRYLPTRN